MKLFTIDKDGKFVPFKEQVFKEENKKIDLENFLGKNPDNWETSNNKPKYIR